MIKKRDQNGYGSTVTVLAAIIVILVILVGWLIYKVDHKNNTPKSVTQAQTNLPVVSNNQKVVSKTYCDDLNIGCLTYPSNWTLTTQTQGQETDVMLISPTTSKNIVEVKYALNSTSAGRSSNDKIIATSNFNSPINGLSIDEAIMSSVNTSYIAVVDQSGLWLHSRNSHNWSLVALPSGQSINNPQQAASWFTTSEAKTALDIIKSFTFK